MRSTNGLTVLAQIEIVVILTIIADLLTSSHPKMSVSHLLGLQGPQQTPARERETVNIIVDYQLIMEFLIWWVKIS